MLKYGAGILGAGTMSNDLFRKPDGNSGPALADREPIVLPDHRKKMVRRVKRRFNL